MIIEMSKGSQITIPARIKRKYGFENGRKLELDEGEEGILLRPIKTRSWEEIRAMSKGITHNLSVEEIKRLGRD